MLERNDELSKGKQQMKLRVNSSSEIVLDRKKPHNTFQEMREKNCQPQILYPAKPSFRIEGEIQRFSGKEKLRESVSSRLPLRNGRQKFSEEVQKGKKNRVSIIGSTAPCQFLKWYFLVEAEILTPSEMVLIVYRGKT